jgi:hypothetical protein
MADSIYDLASDFLTINSTRIVGKIIDIPASLVGLAAEMHHIIPVSLLNSSVPLFANANSFLKELTAKGLFSVKDGIQNIIHIPTDPNVAAFEHIKKIFADPVDGN